MRQEKASLRRTVSRGELFPILRREQVVDRDQCGCRARRGVGQVQSGEFCERSFYDAAFLCRGSGVPVLGVGENSGVRETGQSCALPVKGAARGKARISYTLAEHRESALTQQEGERRLYGGEARRYASLDSYHVQSTVWGEWVVDFELGQIAGLSAWTQEVAAKFSRQRRLGRARRG